MKTPSKCMVLGAVGLGLLIAVLGTRNTVQAGNQEPTKANWYKGNTHTHTYWSDGNAAPEQVVDWYAKHEYDFLVLSDHNILSQGEKWYPIGRDDWRPLKPEHVEELKRTFGEDWVQTRTAEDGTQQMRLKNLPELRARFERPNEFIMIQGEEITDSYDGHPVHINGLNLQELIAPQGGQSLLATIQRNLDAVIEQSQRLNRPMLAHINHPNFGHSLTPRDVASMRGERFFEVYNGHRGVFNNGDEKTPNTDELWDYALTLRLTKFRLGLLYAVAVDDAHNHHGKGATSQPGRGWLWVKADKLDPDTIISAMREGSFYASTGVKLKDFGSRHGSLWLEIEPEEGVTYTTEFLGSRWQHGLSGEVGAVLATSHDLRPSYEMTGDELYVRARVTSSRKHPNPFAEGDMEMAWVQPIVGLEGYH